MLFKEARNLLEDIAALKRAETTLYLKAKGLCEEKLIEKGMDTKYLDFSPYGSDCEKSPTGVCVYGQEDEFCIFCGISDSDK